MMYLKSCIIRTQLAPIPSEIKHPISCAQPMLAQEILSIRHLLQYKNFATTMCYYCFHVKLQKKMVGVGGLEPPKPKHLIYSQTELPLSDTPNVSVLAGFPTSPAHSRYWT